VTRDIQIACYVGAAKGAQLCTPIFWVRSNVYVRHKFGTPNNSMVQEMRKVKLQGEIVLDVCSPCLSLVLLLM
jgi:hypothetical protein